MTDTVNSQRPLNKIITDSISAYFYPLTKYFRTNLRIERIYHYDMGDRKFTSLAYQFSSKIALYNQGAIIEYVLLLAERHKALRIASTKQCNVAKVKNDLITSMNRGFFSAVSENFNLLHEHFSARSGSTPHISIRGHWRTECDDTIITLFRDRSIEGDVAFDISTSTAIMHCSKTGTPYVCNDIPRALINSGYASPRFRSLEAKNELSKKHFPLRRSFLQKNWEKFWEEANHDSTFAYRSNLTVPIMIESERLSKETADRFKVDASGKLIFGYLCFDHYKEDYFDKKLDIPIIKMISDIISIFSFQRLRFTDFSTTFNEAEANDSGYHTGDLKLVAEQLKHFLRTPDEENRVSEEVEMKYRNISLVNADEMMIHLTEDTPFIIEKI